MTRKVGLTGGIGTGKSTVAHFFSKAGIPVLDADQIARKLREPGGLASPLIQKRFGTTDREQLRTLIAQDPKAKKDLEGILHPLIHHFSQKEMDYLIQKNPAAPCIVYEAALLLEAGRGPDFEALILVTAPQTEQVKRVMKRDHCSEAQAKALIQSQSSHEQRLALAQAPGRTVPASIHLIENTGTVHELEEKVLKILDQLKQT